MSTLNTVTIFPDAVIPIGGSPKRIGNWPAGLPRSIADLDVLHVKQVSVAGATAASFTTLWNSSVDAATAFEFLFFCTDPDRKRDSDQQVDLRITNNSVASVWRVSRNVPFWLGPSAQTTGDVTLVEVGNLASTSAGTDDIEAILYLLDDG